MSCGHVGNVAITVNFQYIEVHGTTDETLKYLMFDIPVTIVAGDQGRWV